MPEPTRLMIAGDWHGSRTWARQMISWAENAKVDAILQLGDFGYWPRWSEHTQTQTGVCTFTSDVHDMAEKAMIPIYWVDGNHENHDALEPGQGDYWLRHLPRGHRWQWWGKTWMAVGGGVSVDKKVRTAGWDWFPGEVLSPQQYEHVMREGGVDIVVAHDTVAEIEIPGVHGQDKTKNADGFFPPEAIEESEANRALMSTIAEEKLPSYWFHGHYHSRYNGTWKNPGWIEGGPAMMVVGLDMNGTTLRKNAVILTKDDLP